MPPELVFKPLRKLKASPGDKFVLAQNPDSTHPFVLSGRDGALIIEDECAKLYPNGWVRLAEPVAIVGREEGFENAG